MTNKLIEAGAMRQFKHNDGSEGFVVAYDKEIVDRVVSQDALDAARYRWLEAKHNSGDEDWFVYGASSDDMSGSIDAAISAEKKEGA